jgi:catechol 2,3-dioxygenase-like lactoylglutathione lyase family enzyme
MKVNFLDHIAIRVSDPEVSVQWYENTLKLHRFDDEDRWGYPIMMQASKTGVALFPARSEDDLQYVTSRIHIAFNVDKDSFSSFLLSFQQEGIEFKLEDHHFFRSVYIQDPDGYTVELTTPAT